MIKRAILIAFGAILFYPAGIMAADWQHLGLDSSTVLSLAIDSEDSQNIIAGTSAGLYVTSNGGTTWNIKISSNLSFPDVAYAPLADDSVFVLAAGGSFSDGLYYSHDNGQNWQVIANYLNPRRMAFDPVDSGFMYICFADGILKTQNYGQTVSDANYGLPATDIIDVLGDGTHELEAYAVGVDFLAHTTNFANSWTEIEGLFNMPGFAPRRIAFDLNGPETLYVSCDQYFAFSFNGGLTWDYTSMSSTDNTPIVCDPNSAGILYVGSIAGGGVWRSVDAGGTFMAVNFNLENLNVHSLAISPDGYLLAGTENGVYTIDLATVGIDDNGMQLPQALKISRNYPNPFNNRTLIELSLDNNEYGKVEIFDITGSLVKTLFEGCGRQTLVWAGADDSNRSVASGIYFCRLTAASGVVINRLTLLK